MINELENKIVEASEAYYLGEPIMSDVEFDKLVGELKELDPENSILSMVGFGIKMYGEKSKLPEEVKKSLDKIHKEDLERMFTCGEIVMLSPKADGMSIFLEYKNGKLSRGITRGDGVHGQDITPKLKYIKNIPNELLTNKDSVIRGELVVTYDDFNKYFSEDGANPRNTVSGILYRKSFNDLDKVTFYAHPISEEIIDLLENKYILHYSQLNYTDNLVSDFFKERRDKADIAIDGVVIQRHYSFLESKDVDIFAYKEDTEEVESTVVKVEWRESDKGRLIPIVHYEPVELYGTLCKKASGMNYKHITEKKIGKGAVIRLTKANEIIPYITQVVTPCDDTIDLLESVPELPTKVDGVHLAVDGISLNKSKT